MNRAEDVVDQPSVLKAGVFQRARTAGKRRHQHLASRLLKSVTAPLLPSLARVVRGLSAIFWGLPLALLASAKTVLGEGPRILQGPWGDLFGPWGRVLGETFSACLPGLAAMGLILYGVRQLIRFQPQERIWTTAVSWASLSALMLLSLLPFAHWWSRFPAQSLFGRGVLLLFLAGISFGLALSHLLVRLAAMLPDEILRSDTRLFARVNRVLLLGLLGLASVDFMFVQFAARLPPTWAIIAEVFHENRAGLLLLCALSPLALTMTLVWKAKETIVAGVFRGG